MHTLQLIQIDDEVGAIFPEELLTRLQLSAGDEFFVTETPDGYILTPLAPTPGKEVQAGREFMNEFNDTFRQLAK